MQQRIGFFDVHAKVSGAKRAGPTAAAAPAGEPLTVSQLTARVDAALRAGVPGTVAVRGEVSNWNPNRASGHCYFTLKDAGACVDCVMFKSDAERVKFRPTDGLELVATGRVGVYPQRGRYQLYVSSVTPVGQGALELALQQLRAKLEAEGLFDPRRKRPVPPYPRRLVLVTSVNTAALQDMLKVLRRFPFIRLAVYHVPVQGDGCGQRIADALGHLNETVARRGTADAVLLARGGGSLEDLWGFNEECVARAVFNSVLPVITGIGHEVDVSLADLAADHHAHTPTEAAQVATRRWRDARDAVEVTAVRLRRGVAAVVTDARHRLRAVERHEAFRRPLDRVNNRRQQVDDVERQLTYAAQWRLKLLRDRWARLNLRLAERSPRHVLAARAVGLSGLDARLSRGTRELLRDHRHALDCTAAELEALSPEAVLRRGYSLTVRASDGRLVRSAGDVKPGDRLVTRVADGEIASTADDPRQPRLFE